MQVTKQYHIESGTHSNGDTYDHSIEIGLASWNKKDEPEKDISIRNRWDTNGHFSPHSSSEVNIDDCILMASVAIQEGLVQPDLLMALQGTINNYLNELQKKFVPPKK